MKTLEYVPVPAFEDNYIWLISDGQDAIVVDPGDVPTGSRVVGEVVRRSAPDRVVIR